MKKLSLLSIFLFTVASVGLSQEKKTEKPARITIVKVEDTKPKEKTVSVEDQIKSLNNQLLALDKKEAWIRENPEELLIAVDQGWFENAEKTRVAIQKELKELKK